MLRDTPGRAFDFVLSGFVDRRAQKSTLKNSVTPAVVSWQARSKRKSAMQEQSKGASGMLVLGGEVLRHQANAIAEACMLLL